MIDDALEGVEYRESLKPLLEQLPAREKKILMLRFFGNMTQSQIAGELGISQMHVSRLLARTLAQLRAGPARRGVAARLAARQSSRKARRPRRSMQQEQHRHGEQQHRHAPRPRRWPCTRPYADRQGEQLHDDGR